MSEMDYQNLTLTCSDKASLVPAGHFVAYEMRDDAMHPRIRRGEYAILECNGEKQARVGDELLVHFSDGHMELRTLLGFSDEAVMLGTYNPESKIAVDCFEIASIYCVDMIVPPKTLAAMKSSIRSGTA